MLEHFMEAFDPLRDFKTLNADMRTHIRRAQSIVSHNPEDGLSIRVAMAGFTLNRPLEEWCITHMGYVRHNLDEAFRANRSGRMVDGVDETLLLASLFMGYILGLHAAKKIDDREF